MNQLSKIQRKLSVFYDIFLPEDVADFLCSRSDVEAAAGEPERGEVLLVASDPGGCAWVGLYVDPAAVSQLAEAGDPWLDNRFPAASLATEGVSHFVYLLYRGSYSHEVSQLELELQAEVDKYACAMDSAGEDALRGFGAGLLRQRSDAVRERLFSTVEFLDPPGSEAGDRYRLAHRRAARFARTLEQRFLARGDYPGFHRALRRFYRAGLADKLRLA